MTFRTEAEEETRAVGGDLSQRLAAGDIVLFEGELGAGKTMMIRGLLNRLGVTGAVRSPTFNLIQTFDTDPPVMHADLYRLTNSEGIGLEEYWATHLCLVEWPDRLGASIDPERCWRVTISFEGDARLIEVSPPHSR